MKPTSRNNDHLRSDDGHTPIPDGPSENHQIKTTNTIIITTPNHLNWEMNRGKAVPSTVKPRASDPPSSILVANVYRKAQKR